MKEHGLKVEESLLKQGEYTIEGGYRAAKEFLKEGNLPEAIIGANDLMAIGAIQALKEEGINIPDDVGVAGFGNTPLASLITPRLTTVDVPSCEMGRKAMSILLRCIRDQSKLKEQIVILKTRLIKRESVKAKGEGE